MPTEISSEAKKRGIVPDKAVEDMTREEIEAFLSTILPDRMGFDGQEGMDHDE